MPIAGGTAWDIAGTEGPPVVLVHGLGLARGMWRHQVAPLARTHRVVTYDLHGHGESADPSRMPSLSLFSEQLAALLDHLRVERAAIVGFSLGGMIARRFAMDYRSRVTALAILHSAHARDPAAHASIAARVEQARRDGPAATVEAALVRWFSDAYRATHPDVMDWVRSFVMANRAAVYADIYRVLVQGVDELVAPDPPIRTPTLVMTGEDDFGNSPEMARRIAAEIDGARLVILPKLRHMAMVEAPDVFNQHLVAFLSAPARAA